MMLYSGSLFAQEQQKSEESSVSDLLMDVADGLWKRVKYRLNLEDNGLLQIDEEANKVKVGKYEIPLKPKETLPSDSTSKPSSSNTG